MFGLTFALVARVDWSDFGSPHDWAAFVEDRTNDAFRLTRKMLTEVACIPGYRI